MAKKKPNPRRIPATKADVEKAKKESADTAAAYAMAIIFTALTDKMGMDYEFVHQVYEHAIYVADSVSRKYVTIPQLIHTLREEYGIDIK